ncbi:hypothetical protein [Acidovorax sp. BL-A-41-H1]|uniref:hypothetical protein n=1 Tax=Acidovorax sp. BL-A-41-H1 TaxID=3421102 RepID=UPI003F793C39
MTSLAIASPLAQATRTAAPGTLADAPAAASPLAVSAASAASAASADNATDAPDPAAQRLAHLFRRVSASQVPPELQRALYAHRGVAP